MNCQFCNNEISFEDLFCGECGQKVEQTSQREIDSIANIQKVAPPLPIIPSTEDIPKPSKVGEADKPQAPVQSQTRRRLRAFFLGGAVLTGIGLAGFMVDVNFANIEGGAIFALGSIGLTLLALIVATISKRISIGSALLSVGGGVFAFLSVGIIAATSSIPSVLGNFILFASVFGAFLIPALVFRKG